MSSTRTIGLAVLTAALLAGCGGSSPGLADGAYYGKLVSVDVAQRRLEFVPACRLHARSARWEAVGGGARFTIALASHPRLEVYYRPGGHASAGYAAGAGLRQLARVAAHGRVPDYLPGWYVVVRRGTVAAVIENSGLRPSGQVVRRKLACVLSKRTQAFVRP
jgi:hypothetical protein